jgi:hypothetical protein
MSLSFPDVKIQAAVYFLCFHHLCFGEDFLGSRHFPLEWLREGPWSNLLMISAVLIAIAGAGDL